MDPAEIIYSIVHVLNDMSVFRYEHIDAYQLKIYDSGKNGFDILIQTHHREHILHLDTFHEHFENDDKGNTEMFDLIIKAMFGQIRIETKYKNSKTNLMNIQEMDDAGNWTNQQSMFIPALNFRSDVTYSYLINEAPH